MKRFLVLELLRRLKRQPHFARKLRVVAVVGVIGFAVMLSLLIWAGVSAVSYTVSTVNQVIESPVTREHLQTIQTEAQTLPRLQPLGCWLKTQSLMAVEPWLARPVVDNLVSLKEACFDERPVTPERDAKN